MEKITESQRNLVKYAEQAEASGFLTSMYYRLLPQIIEARAKIAKEKQL